MFGLLILMNVITFLYYKKINKQVNNIIENQIILQNNQNIIKTQIKLEKEADLIIGQNLDSLNLIIKQNDTKEK